MTIELMLIAGGLVGFLFGLLAWNPKVGCALFGIIAVAMIVYVAIWQAQHPESLRSTSGLDFLFGPLWPSLGAFGGWAVGSFVRSLWKDR